ncbi:MAG: hypothetical protein LC790_11975 [Actinobacteria bacterium]|nr:hypothetical protein [Actinomycetota bacterium]
MLDHALPRGLPDDGRDGMVEAVCARPAPHKSAELLDELVPRALVTFARAADELADDFVAVSRAA